MSHFTRIATKLVHRDCLLQALTDLGYAYQEGELQVRGHVGLTAEASITVSVDDTQYDIGFQNDGKFYHVIAYWAGILGCSQAEFLPPLLQRYAYYATRSQLEAQGFKLKREIQENGSVRLTFYKYR
jgi:hypothetical protein